MAVGNGSLDRREGRIIHWCVYWFALFVVGCGNGSRPPGDSQTPMGPGGQSGSAGNAGVTSTNGGTATASGGGGAKGTEPPSHVGGGGGGIVAEEGGAPPSGVGGSKVETGGTGNPSGGAAGVGGSSGAPDDGGAGSGGYPELTAAAIGAPVRVAGGYALAESPLWDVCAHRLLFVDVQGALGSGVINSLAADGTVTAFMSNTNNTNGIAFDIDGSLIMAQMRPGHIARRDKAGMVTVLDPPNSGLHTPDDVIVRSDGTIYFGDGDFCPVGTLLGYGTRLPIFSLKPGTSTLVNNGVVGGPNGIELSPDEKTLYVNAYGEGAIWPFSVAPDGSLTKAAKPLITGLTKPDSLCLDASGNLYVAVSAGLQVLRPDGTKLKLISVTSLGSGCLTPGVTNCTFGGDDGKTLYLTNWTTLYKVENMPIPGLDFVVNKKRLTCN